MIVFDSKSDPVIFLATHDPAGIATFCAPLPKRPPGRAGPRPCQYGRRGREGGTDGRTEARREGGWEGGREGTRRGEGERERRKSENAEKARASEREPERACERERECVKRLSQTERQRGRAGVGRAGTAIARCE